MPRNGSGTYNLPGGNPVVTQTLITSSWANTTMSDLATAISNSLSKDGQTVPSANLPMGGFRHTGAGNPTDRTSYATLGFMQDGEASRVTAVAGTNTLTGNLPGSPSALITGQFVQLVPVLTNTGAVTLNINGIGNKAITTTAGSPLVAGSLVAGRPYLLMYDGTKFVIIAGSSGAFAQAAVSGWDRPSGGSYPAITIVDPSTVNIPAGTGRIVAPGSRDETGVTEVSWSAQNVALTHLASSWVSYIGINSAGSVIQIAGALQPSNLRDLVILGSAVHVNGTVTAVNTAPSIYGDAAYAALDVAATLRNTILSGMNLSANGTGLKFDVGSGTLFSPGADPNDATSPNIASFAARAAVSFNMVTGASGAAAAVTDIPVTFYDPAGAGTPTTLSATTGTAIHRVYQLEGQILVLYGQNEYADLATAVSSLQVDTADTVFPTKLADAVLLGYIIAQKDATNLNDGTKVSVLSAANSAAGGGGGGGGGGLADAPTDGLPYGRKDADWVQVLEAPAGAAGTDRHITYYTLTSPRWKQGADSTAEGGSNAGSNWELEAYDDTGVAIGVAMAVNRATLDAVFFGDVGVSASTLPTYNWTSTGNAANNKKAASLLDNSGNLLFRTLNDDGSTKTEMSLGADGNVKVGTDNVWHAGNFDPDTKANVGAGGGAADSLSPGRLIGGVHFDGTANINLPGVNLTGNQNTTGSAASLTTSRQINGTNFNGTSNITTSFWGTGRTITIGLTGKTVDGSANITWSLAEIGAAALASPAFTGTPTAPTAAPGTNTTQLATTAFTAAAVAGLAPVASPTFTGTPSAPTAAPGTNTTQLATTAFAGAAATAAAAAVIVDSIADGDTTHAPSRNAVFDALAGKQAAGSYAAASHTHAWGDITSGKPTTVSGYGITNAVTNGGSVATITKLTQAAYDALGSKDANTLYVIVG